jgi:hypothetical protein
MKFHGTDDLTQQHLSHLKSTFMFIQNCTEEQYIICILLQD